MPSSVEQLAGEVVAEEFEGWGDEIRQDFVDNAFNYEVGSVLLSETESVKVWFIRVEPGERLHAHRHVNDYFWTALRAGSSIQHSDDGLTRRVTYSAGQTRHFKFPGESYLLHDLCNVGDAPIEFITVEHVGP